MRYPEQARANNREGDVWASYLVTAAGRARENSLRVYFSDDALFSRAVREALPHFRFDAARKDGRPSEIRVLQQFTFRLFRGGIPPSRDPVDERCY